MNKIKVIYDAARKMRDKDSIKGTLKAEALRGQDKILDHSCSFERNGQSCKVKGKTMLEADCDGKKMKLENTIDLQKEGCSGDKHFHIRHAVHGGCMKGGLGRITAILGILSSIKLEEKESGSALLSLQAADIPEDVKSHIHEMLKQCHEHHKPEEGGKEHHMCMKELHSMENMDFTLKLLINDSKEIEKVTVALTGENKDEDNEKQQLKLEAELCLE